MKLLGLLIQANWFAQASTLNCLRLLRKDSQMETYVDMNTNRYLCAQTWFVYVNWYLVTELDKWHKAMYSVHDSSMLCPTAVTWQTYACKPRPNWFSWGWNQTTEVALWWMGENKGLFVGQNTDSGWSGPHLLKALTRKFDCKLCLAYVTINRNALETLNFVSWFDFVCTFVIWL